MSRKSLKKFVFDFCYEREFVIWCPDHSNELYDEREFFECMRSDSPVRLFDYMIVDDICVNGVIQINCHFNNRRWKKDLYYYKKHIDELPVFESEVF